VHSDGALATKNCVASRFLCDINVSMAEMQEAMAKIRSLMIAQAALMGVRRSLV